MATKSSLVLTLLLSVACALPTANLVLPSLKWPGWQGISRMVIFGDSYTTTGFNDTGVQPSASNPLGNPAYPGYTSSNGPNWVDYLTVEFNQSRLETLNLAYGGATLDGALVAPYLPTVLSVKQQIQEEFLPVYGDQNNDKFPWQSRSTLFASFIGINDIGNSYSNANRSVVYPQIFTEYEGLLEQLYDSGARNILFVNVPPVDRSPLTVSAGSAAQATEKAEITAWNQNVTKLAVDFRFKHWDASVFVFDANSLWTTVLDNPCSFAETCAYKNTTDYCVAYENGTPSPYTFDSSCGIPVDEYFWLNTLHPTFRMHNVFASELSKQLRAVPAWL